MSSYPPPPPVAPDGTAASNDAAQHGADVDSHQSHSQTHPPTHPQYAAEAAAAAAAVAAAHHGLQALQAAVAAPAPGQSLSPVTPQQHALVDASFLPVGASPDGAAANPKATRLRRACDMCSQRKVKVRRSTPMCFFVTQVSNRPPTAVRRDTAMPTVP